MNARTILILEDYPLTRKMLRVALEAEGFNIIEAATAGEALALAEQRLPNLVLQDLGLPDMDGIEFLRCLRRLFGGS